MEKLIITNCATDCSMYPEWVNRFHDSQVLAKSVAAACKKGAAIAHIHAPPDDFKAWESHTKAIREHCDIMIQYGISIQSVEQRRVVMKNKPEMISVAVGAHNLAFVGRDLMLLHPRAELAEMMRMCRDMDVKPEFEVCALGDLWLIDDLCQKGLVDDPIMMTIFFGRPGGTWSRPTPAEFMHRINHLPKECYYMTSVTGTTHMQLTTLSVLMGGHVRVGLEDNIFVGKGQLATNAQLVEKVVRIAREFEREIATPDEARQMLQLKGADKTSF